MTYRLTLSAALAISLGSMAPLYAADGDSPAESKPVAAASKTVTFRSSTRFATKTTSPHSKKACVIVKPKSRP